MFSIHRKLIGRCLAATCLIPIFGAAALIAAGSTAGAATPSKGTKPTAASKKPPVYLFLRKSGVSKRARPESAIVRGVITVNRGGRNVVTSTVRAVHRRHQPEMLDAIQAGIVNGVPAEACETTKVGSIELAYSDGNKFTVAIYQHYYEITTSAGTIRFTSPLLTKILRELLK